VEVYTKRLPLTARAQAHAERGETVVWVGWDNKVSEFIALRDEPNPTAAEALHQLRDRGISPVMLSGDSPRTTQAIAAELGLTEYEGDCPPPEKAVRIQAWQEAGERVAMAGDGVNDAPALAQADLSITAADGTDVAGETSDIVLTRPDLTLIPTFIYLSRRTRRIIHQNLGWAFAYKPAGWAFGRAGHHQPGHRRCRHGHQQFAGGGELATTARLRRFQIKT
jgi:Cu+-exporting ATPase